MFTFFRYGLIPVVLFCVVVIAASIDVYSTNAVQKSTWSQTVVTVMESRDFSQVTAEFLGKQNTFPDPHGTVKYVIDGEREHLGRSDAGIILWRKILARELRAIAEGRPAKKWQTPPADIVPTLGF